MSCYIRAMKKFFLVVLLGMLFVSPAFAVKHKLHHARQHHPQNPVVQRNHHHHFLSHFHRHHKHHA